MPKEGLAIDFQKEEGVVIEDDLKGIRLKRTAAEANTHLIITASSGRHVIVEILEDAVEGGTWHHTVEINIGEEAEVEYISLQTAGATAQMHLSHRSTVAAGGRVKWTMATLGGGDVTHALESSLNGHDALSDIAWMFYAHGAEKQKLSARNIFESQNGRGEITMKGVAEGKAHVGCNGMILIGPKGGGTDTYLTQDVLMLDTTAKVDAIPGLEIKTNDVKASHSATVSRVTDEDLFYFAARGIGEREAKQMFVMGFIGELAGKMADPDIQKELLNAVEGKYEQK